LLALNGAGIVYNKAPINNGESTLTRNINPALLLETTNLIIGGSAASITTTALDVVAMSEASIIVAFGQNDENASLDEFSLEHSDDNLTFSEAQDLLSLFTNGEDMSDSNVLIPIASGTKRYVRIKMSCTNGMISATVFGMVFGGLPIVQSAGNQGYIATAQSIQAD
jgi:1-deoxy-D-xylulose 5-phosphate reductoisomerase